MILAYYSVPHLPALCCKGNCSSAWNSSWVALTCTGLQSANLWGVKLPSVLVCSINYSLKSSFVRDNSSPASQNLSPIMNCVSWRMRLCVTYQVSWCSVATKGLRVLSHLCPCASVTQRHQNFSSKTIMPFLFNFSPQTLKLIWSAHCCPDKASDI